MKLFFFALLLSFCVANNECHNYKSHVTLEKFKIVGQIKIPCKNKQKFTIKMNKTPHDDISVSVYIKANNNKNIIPLVRNLKNTVTKKVTIPFNHTQSYLVFVKNNKVDAHDIDISFEIEYRSTILSYDKYMIFGICFLIIICVCVMWPFFFSNKHAILVRYYYKK